MARNISDIVGLMQYILRKQRGVFITNSEATAALDAGQLDSFEEYWKLYGLNQTVHDALRPFKVANLAFTSDATGAVAFPADYLHILGGVLTIYGSTITRVRFVETDEFPDAITSQLRPVTLSSPIAQDIANGFQLYPQQTQVGIYNYMRRPVAPVYATTQVGRVVTYNPGGSTQLEWEDGYINNIIAKALRYCGINMDEDKIYAFAEQYDKETK